MTTRRGRRGRSGAARRMPTRTGWTNFTLTNTTLADGTIVLSDLLGAFTVVEKQQVGTILRILWRFTIRATTAGNLVAGRFGLIRLTDAVVSIAAAGSFPTPQLHPESAWMLNSAYYQEDAANLGIVQAGDLRAKRRLEGFNQTIAAVFESDAGASVGNALFGFSARILFTIK